MRIAYLCNLYPAVSHSFVRREIEAVEGAGHEVYRFSLRPAHGNLVDEGDLSEVRRTEAVLAAGALRLLVAATVLFMSRPIRSCKACVAACRLSGPGLSAKFRHLAYFLEAAWLVRRFDELRVEHLHAHFGTNPTSVAAIVRAWGGPPFSFTVHGPDEFDAPLALSIAAKIKAAAFVAAISSYGRSQLMRWSAPEDWERIHVIRCGVDRNFLDVSAQSAPVNSAEFICVARLSAQKGLPLLIAACDRLREAGERFRVTIIGDGEMRASLEQEIAHRSLSSHIRLAGIRSSVEIRDALASARAFVLPSLGEGLPVALMEALAMARPVIATAIAGIPELVDEQCGWIIPAGDEQALSAAMTAVLKAHPAELAAKGAMGRQRVHRMHDSNRNALAIVGAITQYQSGRGFT